MQILPPLDRIFSLLGVDVFSWYNDLPRVTRVIPLSHYAAESKKVSSVSYLVRIQTGCKFLEWTFENYTDFFVKLCFTSEKILLTLKTTFVLLS